MADPQTVNTGLFVPNTGADVDTWGANALNPDFVALDGLIAGVQTVGVTNVPVTLTSPAGFTPTPSPGPTQSQNRVLRFTGVMTGNVRITLPLPGSYLIDNRTTGAFVLSFQGVTATEVVAIDQGSIVEIYNDGANVRFVNLGKVGALEHWAGINAIPAWVAACTVAPYVLCDGTIYNYSTFPYLGPKFAASFGGNGATTFGVPDLRGRMPLAYDGTGARITTAGCGINGQTMGAAGGLQSVTLVANQIPSLASSGVNTISVSGSFSGFGVTNTFNTGTAPNPCVYGGNVTYTVNSSGNNNIAVNYTNGAQQVVNNVQPSQVTGIWVAKT